MSKFGKYFGLNTRKRLSATGELREPKGAGYEIALQGHLVGYNHAETAKIVISYLSEI